MLKQVESSQSIHYPLVSSAIEGFLEAMTSMKFEPEIWCVWNKLACTQIIKMMRINLSLILSANALFLGAQQDPEVNVVHGAHHIFTIETPMNWVNDKTAARSIGLVSFFYSKEDASKNPRSYFYAMGYDKDERLPDLRTFMENDLERFKSKYPELRYEEVGIGFSGSIIDAKMLAFENLSDRFKEEVIYMETDYSIFVFPFSALTEQDYKKYQPIFDQFMSSFTYRGSDPKPFLDWLKNRN